MACDMPETCEFPSLDSCQKRFLWALVVVIKTGTEIPGGRGEEELRSNATRCPGILWEPIREMSSHATRQKDRASTTQSLSSMSHFRLSLGLKEGHWWAE